MRKLLTVFSLALALAWTMPAYAEGPGDAILQIPAETAESGTDSGALSGQEQTASSGSSEASDESASVPSYVPIHKIPHERYLFIPHGMETSTDGIETFRTLNDPRHGNEGYMRNNRSAGNPYQTDWEALHAAMEAFVQKYGVTSCATPFEKELAIIRGIMHECSYAETEDLSAYTAYSCRVQHKAQCAGYADAFLQLVRYAMPGTDVRYIHSDWHAWNLIQLDGDWYHVDVTWEDDDSANEIRNYFVNLEDDLIEAMGYHHWVREDSGVPMVSAADGYRYGPMSVELYRMSGGAYIQPEPPALTLSASGLMGVMNGEDVFQQTLSAVSQAMTGSQRIVRVFIPGLNHGGSRESIRTMMQQVTNVLHRQMMYVARPWYDFRGGTLQYRVTMTGTMIEIILPDMQS